MEKFKVLVDADACPVNVKNIIIKQSKIRNIKVIMYVDFNHEINDGYSKVVTVEQGSDSVDFKILGEIKINDVVITQDYGMAAIALAKGAKVVHPNGMVYNDSNIDGLLNNRFLGQKLRRQGKHMKGRQLHEGKEKFINSFLKVINSTSY